MYFSSINSDESQTVNDEPHSQINNSIESEIDQSLVRFSDATENKPKIVVPTVLDLPKEPDREGYVAGNEDSDEERTRDSGIGIPTHDERSSLSAVSPATAVPKRPHQEGTQNYRKTLRLSSEQIVSKFLIVDLWL